MNNLRIPVLYEDNHLVVVDKPAGLPTQGAAAEEQSVVTLVKADLRERYHKPGNVFLGVVSRLDSLVSGVLVLARTSKGAARLNASFSSREVRKTYLAIAPLGALEAHGEMTDFLLHNDQAMRVEVVGASAPGAQLAKLRYQRISQNGSMGLFLVALETGRKHQIRLQFAHRGCSIVGDRKYGSQLAFPKGIGLHSLELVLPHPTSDRQLTFAAPLPNYWPEWAHKAMAARTTEGNSLSGE